jgi:hypothetical protein
VNLDLKSREFIHIQKVRKDLDSNIVWSGCFKNDSILHVASMSEARVSYFENYIDTLKEGWSKRWWETTRKAR